MTDNEQLEEIKEILKEMKESDCSESISQTLHNIEDKLGEISDSLSTIATYFSRKDDELIKKQRAENAKQVGASTKNL